jgi:uncharacterized protein (TIGR02996 family)
MTDDRSFIRAILAEPGNISLRLVYADWLEEQDGGDSLRFAEYIRVECEMDGLPPKHPKRRGLNARLREIRAAVSDDRWRELDWPRVEYCVEFEYRCPRRWDALVPTQDPKVRHCPECREDVHYCRNSEEAHRLADVGCCVAIDSRQVRIPLGFARAAAQQGRRLLGRVAPRAPQRIPLNRRCQRPTRE